MDNRWNKIISTNVLLMDGATAFLHACRAIGDHDSKTVVAAHARVLKHPAYAQFI